MLAGRPLFPTAGRVMDGKQVIVALAASSAKHARDRYWEGLLAGVELVIDKAAEEGALSDEWVKDVRDFIAVAREHHA